MRSCVFLENKHEQKILGEPDSELKAKPGELIVKKRTRTEVSLEIHEEVALRAHRISMAQCPACGIEVQMIPANEAAMIAKVTARQIYDLVNSGQLHFTEDPHGLLYVCSESLRNLRHPEPDDITKPHATSR